MSRMVKCIKLGLEAEGLDKPPFKGELGQCIFENVSKQGWKMWLDYSTILINEYRLDLMSERGQTLWKQQAEKFLFEEADAAMPQQFTPPKG